MVLQHVISKHETNPNNTKTKEKKIHLGAITNETWTYHREKVIFIRIFVNFCLILQIKLYLN